MCFEEKFGFCICCRLAQKRGWEPVTASVSSFPRVGLTPLAGNQSRNISITTGAITAHDVLCGTNPPSHSCLSEPGHGGMPGWPHPLAAGCGGHTAIRKPSLSLRALSLLGELTMMYEAHIKCGWMCVSCKDELHLPWGAGKFWAVRPNHLYTLSHVGPRSLEIHSKTCGFYFFSQNVLLCFTWKKLAVADISRIWKVVTCLSVWNPSNLKGYRSLPYWKFRWNSYWGQSDLALVKNAALGNSRWRPNCGGWQAKSLPKVKSIIWLLVVMSGW